MRPAFKVVLADSGGEGGMNTVLREVKIVDLAESRARFPSWLVRRSAEIVLTNIEQLTTVELRSMADVLLREAGSRVVSGEER